MQISFTKLRVAVWLIGLLMSAAVSATADDELGIVRVTDSPEGIAVSSAAGVGYTPLNSAFDDDAAFGVEQVSATMCDACPITPCQASQCEPMTAYGDSQYAYGQYGVDPYGSVQYAGQYACDQYGADPYGAGQCGEGYCGPQGCGPQPYMSQDGCGVGCGTGCGAGCGYGCDDCCEMKPIKIYSLYSLCYPLHKVFNCCSRLKCWIVTKYYNSHLCQWWHCQSVAFVARNQYCCEEISKGAKEAVGKRMRKGMRNGLHDGLCARLSPHANGGEGVALVGNYNMTYAVQPDYFDQRDGRLYSAQGYGIPITVPLAPNVRHTYNYGWGIPSSRLTPVSHPYGQ